MQMQPSQGSEGCDAISSHRSPHAATSLRTLMASSCSQTPVYIIWTTQLRLRHPRGQVPLAGERGKRARIFFLFFCERSACHACASE
eukprot:141180-Amphidinium_carterae.1